MNNEEINNKYCGTCKHYQTIQRVICYDDGFTEYYYEHYCGSSESEFRGEVVDYDGSCGAYGKREITKDKMLKQLRNLKESITQPPFRTLQDYEQVIDMALESLQNTEKGNCVMTTFGECSYDETGCGSCAVVEKVRDALKADPGANRTYCSECMYMDEEEIFCHFYGVRLPFRELSCACGKREVDEDD